MLQTRHRDLLVFSVVAGEEVSVKRCWNALLAAFLPECLLVRLWVVDVHDLACWSHVLNQLWKPLYRLFVQGAMSIQIRGAANVVEQGIHPS